MTTKLTDTKIEAIKTARSWLERRRRYFDIETTGLRGDAEIVNLALIDHAGYVLIDTLVRPTSPIPAEATKIHGITNEMVIDAPGFSEIAPNLIKLTQDKLIVIYNASFDERLLYQSAQANGIKLPTFNVVCAMKLYAQFYGEWNDYRHNYRWQPQSRAARQLGIKMPDDLHRAAADAQLCRLIVEGMAGTAIPGDEAEGNEKPQVEILADLIKANRGASAVVDNDNWRLMKPLPEEWEEWNDQQEDEWYETEGWIASNHQFPDLGISEGYGILEAMAYILGIKLERP